jgi:hypothetical protein
MSADINAFIQALLFFYPDLCNRSLFAEQYVHSRVKAFLDAQHQLSEAKRASLAQRVVKKSCPQIIGMNADDC